MGARDVTSTTPAMRLASGRVCVLMTAAQKSEADEVGRKLLEQNEACFVTYQEAEELLSNVPVGRIALVILAADESPSVIRGVLGRLRGRWMNCPLAVIGDIGGGEHEMAARECGAFFFTRPVSREQWSALVEHAVRLSGKVQAQAS